MQPMIALATYSTGSPPLYAWYADRPTVPTQARMTGSPITGKACGEASPSVGRGSGDATATAAGCAAAGGAASAGAAPASTRAPAATVAVSGLGILISALLRDGVCSVGDARSTRTHRRRGAQPPGRRTGHSGDPHVPRLRASTSHVRRSQLRLRSHPKSHAEATLPRPLRRTHRA